MFVSKTNFITTKNHEHLLTVVNVRWIYIVISDQVNVSCSDSPIMIDQKYLHTNNDSIQFRINQKDKILEYRKT